jgi:DNA-binding beta-propeller fold protein YncE
MLPSDRHEMVSSPASGDMSDISSNQISIAPFSFLQRVRSGMSPFSRVRRKSGLIGLFLILATGVSGAQLAAPSPSPARDMVAVDFSMNPADSTSPPSSHFRPGENVIVRFSIRDKVSGTPLEGIHPAAWLDLHGEKDPPASVSCKERVRKLLNASFLSRPEIDLNSYYVIVMNDDATLSVVDPQSWLGSSRAIATVRLPSSAADWVFGNDQKLLFVSMPATGQIAVIDTTSWQVIRIINSWSGIRRISLKPDGRYIWAAYDDGASSGAAAIDISSFQTVGRIQTGAGPHEITFSTDSRQAFVTNGAAGTISVIDTTKMTKMLDMGVGRPDQIAFSDKSGFAYVADTEQGTITVLDGTRGVIVTVIHLEPGLSTIRFARDGRFGIVLNTSRKRIYVLDSSSNRIVQTGGAEGQPDQVTFSGTLAYVRQRGSQTVIMIPLDSLGGELKELPEAEFPAGQHALDQGSVASPADSIVQAPGENAVFVANPRDHSVYYYEEGMAAPMGFFTDGPREPRALLALDRSLREVAKGVYQTTTHFERPGLYTVALLLDSPPSVECWDITVDSESNQPKSASSPLTVQSLLGDTVKADVPVTFHFRILDSQAKIKSGVQDVKVLIFRAPGAWHESKPARALDEGVYEVTLPPLQPGVYYLNMQSSDLGLSLDSTPIILHAVAQ